jgi:hypothetical protein
MQSAQQSAQQSVHHGISFAKYKLFELEIPMQLRATSYLRLCCSAMRKKFHTSYLIQQFRSEQYLLETSYLELLRRLAERDPEWWNLCYVSYEGFLKSNDSTINQYLQPLNYFVQMQLSEFSSVDQGLDTSSSANPREKAAHDEVVRRAIAA